MLDEGVCADVKVGSEHLRLFSEQNAQGVQASVYNVIAKNWIAPSESVETIEPKVLTTFCGDGRLAGVVVGSCATGKENCGTTAVGCDIICCRSTEKSWIPC